MYRPLALAFALFGAAALGLSPAQATIQTSAEHALLMDADTGQILWQKDGLTPMPPASMSKLMTLDLLFQRLKDGRVKLTDTFPVSERAWSTQGSKMFVSVGSNVPVEDLIRGIIVDSGNDACIVVAEALGGTVEGFVKMMNQRAKDIGLKQSTFVNPDGLPEPPGQMMSALDLAKLARNLIEEFPQYYPYFSERSFTWNNITQQNRDQVLGKVPGADGLKTGHIDASGYGIIISAKRDGRRFILVLNGLRYPQYTNDYFPNIKRSQEAGRIMDIAFREFRSYPIAKAGKIVGQAPVEEGMETSVPATVSKDFNVTMQVGSHDKMKLLLKYYQDLKAPVKAGQKVGVLTVTAPDFPPLSTPVYAAKPVEHVGFIRGLWRKAVHKIWPTKKK
jgi:D-alanyl-D-alanine carboxypeptidase (penicillin-binding protein 5/6)